MGQEGSRSPAPGAALAEERVPPTPSGERWRQQPHPTRTPRAGEARGSRPCPRIGAGLSSGHRMEEDNLTRGNKTKSQPRAALLPPFAQLAGLTQAARGQGPGRPPACGISRTPGDRGTRGQAGHLRAPGPSVCREPASLSKAHCEQSGRPGTTWGSEAPPPGLAELGPALELDGRRRGRPAHLPLGAATVWLGTYRPPRRQCPGTGMCPRAWLQANKPASILSSLQAMDPRAKLSLPSP